jgi:hypothetical protein
MVGGVETTNGGGGHGPGNPLGVRWLRLGPLLSGRSTQKA